jgi:hypothetical protein
MRILDEEKNEPARKVAVYLTAEEARHLRDSLDLRFEEDEQDWAEWHMHVDDEAAGYELFVAIYDPADATLESHWRRFFNEDVWEPPPG